MSIAKLNILTVFAALFYVLLGTVGAMPGDVAYPIVATLGVTMIIGNTAERLVTGKKAKKEKAVEPSPPPVPLREYPLHPVTRLNAANALMRQELAQRPVAGDLFERDLFNVTWAQQLLVLEENLVTHRITRDEARVRYDEMLRQYKKLNSLPYHHCGGKLYEDYTFCPEHAVPRWLDTLVWRPEDPMSQLYKLSAQYGLPVETPLQKQEPLPPLAIGPPVSGGGLASYLKDAAEAWAVTGVTGACACGSCEDEPGDGVPSLEESLDGYIPAGTDDLRRELKMCLSRQSADARKTAFTSGRKRRWQVSPEWAAELRALRNRDGDPMWRGPGKFLYGYPVTVSEEYGIPDLVAL